MLEALVRSRQTRKIRSGKKKQKFKESRKKTNQNLFESDLQNC